MGLSNKFLGPEAFVVRGTVDVVVGKKSLDLLDLLRHQPAKRYSQTGADGWPEGRYRIVTKWTSPYRLRSSPTG